MGTTQSQAQRGYALLSVSCASCGAPAAYDIVKHTYTCAYCGNTTPVELALKQRKGFRSLHRQRLQASKDSFAAVTCTCSNCAAQVVFPPNEVLQTCSFCGSALVRRKYLRIPEFPELVVPFRLTPDEARERFASWCAHNARRREAKHLSQCLDQMQGYYLPFELVRGPIDCMVSREGSTRNYSCGGFLSSVFVNTSEQLDNLTLNGMEPFDLRELREFDFGYLAQHKAKVDEIDAKALDERVRQEVAASYRPVVQRALETQSIDIDPDTKSLLRMPVLLPVYYIHSGNVCAAVNGQTGKVAVRSERVRKTMPWWIRPIVATLAVFVAALAVTSRLMGSLEGGLILAGGFTLVMALIFYTAYSNAYEGQKRRTLDPKILTSTEVFERAEDGMLREATEVVAEDPVKPLFFENVDGVRTQVDIRFTTPWRAARAIALTLAAPALPLLIAFVLNGLSTRGLHPEGSAVWLCIFVPVAIAYLIKMGRIDIYENPLVYVTDEQDRRRKIKTESRTATVGQVIQVLFSPSLALVALGLMGTLAMCVYLTLGG